MSLSDLPAELIVDVFKAVDTISSAAALSQTSHHLHATWRSNLPSICDAVLPRMIEGYDQARRFLELRETSNVVTGQSSVEEKANAAILRATSLVVNADTALLKFNRFKFEESDQWGGWDSDQWGGWAFTKGNKHKQKDRTFDDCIRIRFLQGWYPAKSLVHLVKDDRTELLKPILASMHLLDLFRAYEVMEWMLRESYSSEEEEEEVAEGCRFVYKLIYMDLRRIPGMQPLIDELLRENYRYRLIIYVDRIKEKTERAKGVSLADLLPLLPKTSTLDTEYGGLPQQ